MWTRAELKSTARQILQKNYWSGVLVTLILSIVIGNFSFGTSVNFNDVTDSITNTGNSILTDNSYMGYTDQSVNLQFNILRHTDFHGVNTWNNHFPSRSCFSFLSFCTVRGWL